MFNLNWIAAIILIILVVFSQIKFKFSNAKIFFLAYMFIIIALFMMLTMNVIIFVTMTFTIAALQLYLNTLTGKAIPDLIKKFLGPIGEYLDEQVFIAEGGKMKSYEKNVSIILAIILFFVLLEVIIVFLRLPRKSLKKLQSKKMDDNSETTEENGEEDDDDNDDDDNQNIHTKNENEIKMSSDETLSKRTRKNKNNESSYELDIIDERMY